MTGNQYRDLIASYIHHNYAPHGLVVYVEVALGKTVIGKDRYIDVFVIRPEDRKAIAIECKYQDSLGTVDEKIPYALQDLEALWVPGLPGVRRQGLVARRAAHARGVAAGRVLPARSRDAGARQAHARARPHARRDLRLVGSRAAREQALQAALAPGRLDDVEIGRLERDRVDQRGGIGRDRGLEHARAICRIEAPQLVSLAGLE